MNDFENNLDFDDQIIEIGQRREPDAKQNGSVELILDDEDLSDFTYAKNSSRDLDSSQKVGSSVSHKIRHDDEFEEGIIDSSPRPISQKIVLVLAMVAIIVGVIYVGIYWAD